MERKKYLRLRNENAIAEIMYIYYSHKVSAKGLEIYPIESFIQSLNIWTQMTGEDVVNAALGELDRKHEIQELTLNGKVIKYL